MLMLGCIYLTAVGLLRTLANNFKVHYRNNILESVSTLRSGVQD